MNKKLGWYELTQDEDLGYSGLIIKIFSIKFRDQVTDRAWDCYSPEIILELDQDDVEGWWFITGMHIENPEIPVFAELALKVLEEIKDKNFDGLNTITAHLSTFLEDKVPERFAE